MIPAGSRDTLLANGVQQACAAVLLLTLPNILSRTDYAQTVYVIVLLSTVALADLGMSLVYSRAVPSLVATGNTESVRRWDATVLGVGTGSAVVFSLVIVALYFVRYQEVINTLLLLPIPLLAFWGSFHVTRMNARGEFGEYRAFISVRALATLTTVPLSWLIGATGWFVGQLVSALTVFARIRTGFRLPSERIDIALLRGHLLEGLILSLATVSWLQLINFARLYASVHYPDDVLATYGVMAAAYQSLAALVISGFLPVTVDILRRFGISPIDACSHVTVLLKRTGILALIGALIAAEAAPWVLRFLFRTYTFEPRTVFVLVFSVAFFPFIICWGNCLVGLQRASSYVALILLALGLGWGMASVLDAWFFPAGAAIGQLVVLATYPALLLAAVLLFASPDMRRALAGGAKIYLLTLVLTAAYTLARWM